MSSEPIYYLDAIQGELSFTRDVRFEDEIKLIFGDLDGSIRFTTQGETDADPMRNANGTVTMRVANGRLPAIAQIETLLGQ